ncbi:tetratricopeptide repeat protein [Azospirillum sp. SYSU D00513]|uniref:tetratricopeptide repeat protein n=1 Tax=Azospirillum sp. SYSU D00513 TaxID=2812561 RepID=UPI001A963213|nr:tetratricopeptide repeat protein [Azospirillum sp. SYSU D00513]
MATISEALSIALDLQVSGRLDEAGVLYGRILDADPDNPRALYLAGTLMCQQSRFGEAEPLLARAVALAPEMGGAHLTLAKIHARAADWGAAARGSRRTLALDPGDTGAWDLLAASSQQAGLSDEAIAALARAHRAAPEDAGTAERLALLLQERGSRHLGEQRNEAALADLSAAAGLVPFDIGTGYALGAALLETGRNAEALALHERLLASSPGEARILRQLGTALWRAGRTDAAACAFQRAAAADPDFVEPCEALASLFDRHIPAQAVHWSTRALALKLGKLPETERGPLFPADREAGGSARTSDVVSFSLWGALEAYCAGAVMNARQVPVALPGWRCRFYHDDTVPPHILAELASLGAELVAMPSETTARQGMFWRFLVCDDPAVRRFLCRDCDSRFTARELAAVEEWIASGLPFHVMRDHVMHMEPVMGGMWGGTAGLLSAVGPAIDEFTVSHTSRWNDQHFLAAWLWPRIAGGVLVHDGVHAGMGRPFPECGNPEEDHVGAKVFHLVLLPPPRAVEAPGNRAEGEGRRGRLVYPSDAPHIGRSLAMLGEWLELETAFLAGFLREGDAVVDAGAGIGVHAAAFGRAVGPVGRVLAAEESPALFECLVRTIAANGLENVTAPLEAGKRLEEALDAGPADRLRLVRVTVGRSGLSLGDGLARAILRSRPTVYARIEDDAAAAGAFARLQDLGYRLWWHIVPVFNPGNRFGAFANPFPGLVTVNALALPDGRTPPRLLPEIVRPDAGWSDAAWRLRCDGR